MIDTSDRVKSSQQNIAAVPAWWDSPAGSWYDLFASMVAGTAIYSAVVKWKGNILAN